MFENHCMEFQVLDIIITSQDSVISETFDARVYCKQYRDCVYLCSQVLTVVHCRTQSQENAPAAMMSSSRPGG